MTSSDTIPASIPHNKAEEVDALSLSKYLEILPLPAIIFSFTTPTITAESLEVCFVNNIVWETIGDQHDTLNDQFGEASQNFVSRDFKALLHAQLLTPSTSHFIQWLNEITQPDQFVNHRHHLKTRFKGYSPQTEPAFTNRGTQFVEIEWYAVFMEGKYIVVTGRRTSAVQFSNPSVEPPSDVSLSLPSAIDEENNVVKPSVNHNSTSTSSNSSGGSSGVKGRRKKTKRGKASTNSSRSQHSSLAEEYSPEEEVDPWTHDEKVHLSLTMVNVGGQSNGWWR